MIAMETIGDRVRRLRGAQGIERKLLAREAQMSYSGLSDLESGKAKSTTKLHLLARALNVSVDWLATGAGPMQPESQAPAPIAPPETSAAYVRFPLLEGFAGMGRGEYMGDFPEIVTHIEVTREWANHKLHGVPHEAVRVITGRGDSMRGTYADGDLIFLDARIKQFTGDSAYCYRWAGQVHIKRLQLIGRNIVRILSANPAYPPVDVPLDDIEIGGRALAAWTLTEF